MKKTKILTLIILSIFGLCSSCVYKSNIANGITGTQIKEVEMGMTLEEVIAILGKPYEIESLAGLHNFSCKNPKQRLVMSVNENTDIVYTIDSIFNDADYCCDGNKDDILRGKRVALTYTKPIRFSKYYPMLWVHFDSNYRVWSVFAKRYEFMDDICIYSLSWKIDETTLEEIQGEVSLFINEELFNKCFKK